MQMDANIISHLADFASKFANTNKQIFSSVFALFIAHPQANPWNLPLAFPFRFRYNEK
jgi:hypothetical protein